MPRPIWTGSISFGLVNIPIKIFSATESHRVAFHEFEEGSGERIRHKRVAEKSGHEVAWEKIQKGFTVGKDRYVVLTDEELEAAEPRKTHTIDIEQFVPLADIDPVNWDQTYFAAPDGAAAAKAYVLLREAMQKEKRVAIGRFVMRTKEYVVCIRPFDDALALHTMFFADEVRSVKEVVSLPARTAVGTRELTMAAQLIGSLSGRWDPRAHKDTFKERVLAVVKKKERGETIEIARPRDKAPRVVDLMAALKATLEQGAPAAKQPAPVRRTAAVSRTNDARHAARLSHFRKRLAPRVKKRSASS
jgi:DNA end-binding protein Ku